MSNRHQNNLYQRAYFCDIAPGTTLKKKNCEAAWDLLYLDISLCMYVCVCICVNLFCRRHVTFSLSLCMYVCMCMWIYSVEDMLHSLSLSPPLSLSVYLFCRRHMTIHSCTLSSVADSLHQLIHTLLGLFQWERLNTTGQSLTRPQTL